MQLVVLADHTWVFELVSAETAPEPRLMSKAVGIETLASESDGPAAELAVEEGQSTRSGST